MEHIHRKFQKKKKIISQAKRICMLIKNYRNVWSSPRAPVTALGIVKQITITRDKITMIDRKILCGDNADLREVGIYLKGLQTMKT